MNEPLCPSNLAIDPIATVLYILLAIGVMIIIVSILWKRHQPGCRQLLFGPTFVLLLVLILLAPVGQVIAWYVLRVVGTQATAVVIDHPGQLHINSNTSLLLSVVPCGILRSLESISCHRGM